MRRIQRTLKIGILWVMRSISNDIGGILERVNAKESPRTNYAGHIMKVWLPMMRGSKGFGVSE